MVPEQALELLLLERGLVAPEQVMHLRGAREEAARRGVQLPLAAQLIELGCPPVEVPALQAEAAARARGCPRCRRIALGPPGGGPAACPGCGAPLAGLVPPSSQRLPAVGLAQSAAGSSTRLPRLQPPLQGAPPGASGRFPAGSAPGTGSHLVAVPAPMDQAGGLVRPAPPQVPSTAPGEASAGEDPGWGVGRRIGRYEVLEELGRGAMGAVYLVQPLDQPGRELALKLLLGGDMASPARRKRFEDEVRLLMRLDHPNLVKVHDWGLADGLHPFYVMDFVPGRDLRQMVKEGPIPVRDATRIVMHLARAVHHAHSQGVIHRDLKPDNVRVAELDLAPTLIDFGLAKDLEGASGLTRTGVALGTPHYMAPEQAEGRHREVDARTDVWALGVILYELLAGSVPFTAKSLSELARMIAREEPAALRKQRPEVSRPLEDVVRRALKKRPDERWQSAGAMAEGLAAVLEGRVRSGGGVPVTAVVAGVILCLGGLLATLVTSGVLGGLLDGGSATTPAPGPVAPPPQPGPGPPPADLEARLVEARASLDRARVADSLVDYRAGLEQVERALSGLLEQGDRPEGRYLRGVVRRDLDRWDEARLDLVEAARGPGLLARALLARGVVELRWMGQRVDAEVAWKQARPEGQSPPAAERAAAALAEALRAGLSGDLAAARRGVDAVLAERPEPEVASEALCALAWTLCQQVARGADAVPALAALLTAERLFRAPRFRYDYALDRALLLCAAGREGEAERALDELRALSRAGQGALLVEAQLRRKQRRHAEALQALGKLLAASGARGVDRAEVEALARMIEAESRGGEQRPPEPKPLPDATPQAGQALVVSLALTPGDPRLNVELNVPADPGVDGMRISLRGPEGWDLDLHGRWGERIGSDAELQRAQYHRTSWGPDEDLLLRRGRTGDQELRTGKLQLLVMRLGPAVEAVQATMTVVTLRPGDPAPRLWADGDLFHQETDTEVARRIAEAQKAWVEGDAALALQGLLDLARQEPRHLLYRGSLLAELGRWDEVEAGLAPLKQQAPQDPRLIVWLARAARARGRAAEGAKELAKLVQGQPDLLRPRLELIECLLAAGRSAEALRAAQEVLARDPWECRAAVLAAAAELADSEEKGVARMMAFANKAETSPPALERALDELLRRGRAEPALQLLAGAQQRWKGLTPILLAYQAEALARAGRAADQARVEALLDKEPMAPGTRVRVQAVRERIAGLKR